MRSTWFSLLNFWMMDFEFSEILYGLYAVELSLCKPMMTLDPVGMLDISVGFLINIFDDRII